MLDDEINVNSKRRRKDIQEDDICKVHKVARLYLEQISFGTSTHSSIGSSLNKSIR